MCMELENIYLHMYKNLLMQVDGHWNRQTDRYEKSVPPYNNQFPMPPLLLYSAIMNGGGIAPSRSEWPSVILVFPQGQIWPIRAGIGDNHRWWWFRTSGGQSILTFSWEHLFVKFLLFLCPQFTSRGICARVDLDMLYLLMASSISWCVGLI